MSLHVSTSNRTDVQRFIVIGDSPEEVAQWKSTWETYSKGLSPRTVEDTDKRLVVERRFPQQGRR